MGKTTRRMLGIGMALGLVALVGLLGLLMAAPVLAQGNTPPTPPIPGSGQGLGWGRGFGLGRGFGGLRATFDAVAEALGLTPEQLFSELHSGKTLKEIAEEKGVEIQTVFEAARVARVQQMKDAIRQAVEDGRMTQEQADWLLEGLEKGYFPRGRGFGFGQRFGFGRGFGGLRPTFDAVAEALGLTPEQLFSELHSGKTLKEIAEEKGVEIQQVFEAARVARVQQMKDAIQQAVEDGRMTQEQADWLLEGLEKGYFPRGRGFGFGRRFGFGRGFGGLRPTFDAVAEALGLTPDQLFSELHSGKTLKEIAEEKGVEIQQVFEAARVARVQRMKDAIQQAVEDGRMTQEQADWLLEGLEKGHFPMGRGFRYPGRR